LARRFPSLPHSLCLPRAPPPSSLVVLYTCGFEASEFFYSHRDPMNVILQQNVVLRKPKFWIYTREQSGTLLQSSSRALVETTNVYVYLVRSHCPFFPASPRSLLYACLTSSPGFSHDIECAFPMKDDGFCRRFCVLSV